jgi:hypothetical protein
MLLVGIDVEKDTLCSSFLRLGLFLAVHYVGKFIVRGVSHSHSKCRSDRLVYMGHEFYFTDTKLIIYKTVQVQNLSDTMTILITFRPADTNTC